MPFYYNFVGFAFATVWISVLFIIVWLPLSCQLGVSTEPSHLCVCELKLLVVFLSCSVFNDRYSLFDRVVINNLKRLSFTVSNNVELG